MTVVFGRSDDKRGSALNAAGILGETCDASGDRVRPFEPKESEGDILAGEAVEVAICSIGGDCGL